MQSGRNQKCSPEGIRNAASLWNFTAFFQNGVSIIASRVYVLNPVKFWLAGIDFLGNHRGRNSLNRRSDSSIALIDLTKGINLWPNRF
jgi:hypothetical protein